LSAGLGSAIVRINLMDYERLNSSAIIVFESSGEVCLKFAVLDERLEVRVGGFDKSSIEVLGIERNDPKRSRKVVVRLMTYQSEWLQIKRVNHEIAKLPKVSGPDAERRRKKRVTKRRNRSPEYISTK
jgi:hypothetical protein